MLLPFQKKYKPANFLEGLQITPVCVLSIASSQKCCNKFYRIFLSLNLLLKHINHVVERRLWETI